MKPLVIYHASCADGFGAAFAAWLKLGEEAEYLPMQYGFVNEDIPALEGREIYMLDFSWPKPLMDELFANAKRVVWLDHHKTAFEMWCVDFGGYTKGMTYIDDDDDVYQKGHVIHLNDNKSGAMLAWEYFHPNTEAPMLIKHIDDYDRWQFKIEGTKPFNRALWSYAPWSFQQWFDMFSHNPYPVELAGWLYQEGEAILRAHNWNVHGVVKWSARKCEISYRETNDIPPLMVPWRGGEIKQSGIIYQDVNKSGLAANCPPHLISDVGHELATQSGAFGLCWCLSKEGLIANCSLRSNGDYDVSAIAKAFGGGGHRNAAGFEVPIATLLGWLK